VEEMLDKMDKSSIESEEINSAIKELEIKLLKNMLVQESQNFPSLFDVPDIFDAPEQEKIAGLIDSEEEEAAKP
jgi:hypothetical protein